jgi:hypothetical protein
MLNAAAPWLHGRRIAVVQHSHTLKNKAALLAGRLQLQGPTVQQMFAHYVILWVDVSGECRNYTGALPFQQGVYCLESRTIARSLPAVLHCPQMMRGPHSSRIHVGTKNWAWNNCDAAYLAWFKLTGSGLDHPYYWFLEWDVYWVGSLATILAAYHDAVNPRHEDYLIDNIYPVIRSYAHVAKFDPKYVSFDDLVYGMPALVRVSHRLLKRVVDFTQHNRSGMFCEMLTATMCMMPPVMMPSCQLGSLTDGPQSHLFRSPRAIARNRSLVGNSPRPFYNWDALVTPWVVETYAPNEMAVMHRFKWALS